MPLGLAGPTGALKPQAWLAAAVAVDDATALPVLVSAIAAAVIVSALTTATPARALRTLSLLSGLNIGTSPFIDDSVVKVVASSRGKTRAAGGTRSHWVRRRDRRHRRSLSRRWRP